MGNTYKAVLKGNCLEWLEAPPTNLDSDKPVTITITLADDANPLIHPATRGEKMVAALEKLAALNAVPDITDPVEWQHETRRERILPDRNT